MKFLAVQMPAFGPFTEFRLDFGPSPGLQVIYGPNESGKSSSLRAVRALLYGVKRQTSDDFLHQYSQLRVGATLQHSDGRVLEVVRRKGRKNTLLDPEGEALDESCLTAFIGNLTEDVFDRLYGLDHRTLSIGGRALLEEGGKVGESLFAANVGPAFRQVRHQLRAEADELWRPRGRTQQINAALSDWKSARRQTRDSTLQVSNYQALRSELEAEEQEARRLKEDLAAARAHLKALHEQRKALPNWARLKELRLQVEECGDLPDLAEDFSTRRERARAEYDRASHELRRLKEELARVNERLAPLPSDWPVLALTETVERLHQRAPRIVDVENELLALAAELKHAEEKVAHAREELGTDQKVDLDSFPDQAVQAEARHLALQHQALTQDGDTLADALGKNEARQTRLSSELESLEESEEFAELELLGHQARRGAAWERRLEELDHEIRTQNSSLQSSLHTLPVWSGTVEELRQVRVPSSDTIEDFARRLSQAGNDLTLAQKEVKRLRARVKTHAQDLERLEAGGAVPSPERLAELRGKRQESFHQVLDRWKSGHTPAEAQPSLLNYSDAVRRADEHGDQMVQNADRVARRMNLQSTLEKAEKELAEAVELDEQRQQESARLREEWESLWPDPSVSVRSPAEMRRWVERRASILDEAQIRDRLKLEHVELVQKRDSLLQQISTELCRLLGGEVPALDRLGEAADYLDQKLAAARQASGKRSALVQSLAELKNERDELVARQQRFKEKLSRWRKRWNEVAAQFFHDREPTPVALQSRLESYEELQRLLHARNGVRERHKQHSREKELFEKQLDSLLQSLPELRAEIGDHPPVALAEILYSRLQAARKEQQARRALEDRVAEIEEARKEARYSLQQAQETVTALLAEAGVSELDALPQLETAVQKRRQLSLSMTEVGDSLRLLSGGVTLDEFCRRLAEISVEALDKEIQELEERVEELDRSHGLHREHTGELREKLQRMDGSDQAARAAEEAAHVMACGVESIRRFVRLELAERILRDEIENYRLENERPILKRSSHYFSQLTCGAYTDLQSGFDEAGGEPILEAVAESGRLVTVDGMSEGTRDQLFLSLRLATIDQRARHAESFPLIADDLLVHFDQERALATLGVLAEFAKEHQVLLFTHLERDRVLAEGLDKELVAVKRLERIKL